MPTIRNNGLTLYYETVGVGPALFLQHGFTSNLERWYLSGVVDALSSQFQLVLLDARGHGKSSKPHSIDEYSWDKRVSDVVAVANEIGVERFSFWGYSMGAIYAYWIGSYIPERLNKLIIGGLDPYKRDVDSLLKSLDGKDTEAFIQQFEKAVNTTFSVEFKDRLRQNDLVALAAAAKASVDMRLTLNEIPRSLGCDCLIYCAANDPRMIGSKKSAQEISNSIFIELPELNHLTAAINNDFILPYVAKFLSDCPTGSA